MNHLEVYSSKLHKTVNFPSLYYIQDTPAYSSEEKALMAEILRDDHLSERREKARREDFKLHDAKQRRMFRVAQAEALEKER